MNIVNAKLRIELTNDVDNSNPYFSEGWNFKVDRYTFTKLSDKEVEVSFSFEANLIEQEGEHIGAQEIPSEHTKEFQPYEEEVETVLDLVSLSTGRGIKIKARSYSLSSTGIGSSLPGSNSAPISLSDIDGIQKRFDVIKKAKDANKRLTNSLRAYRLSQIYEDVGDKIGKLWSIIEQLYKNEGGLLITDETKLTRLKQYIDKLDDLTPEEKSRLFQRVKSTQKKTAMGSLVEGIDLMTYEGTMSKKEKKEMLIAWRTARSMQAHGDIIPKRDEDIDDILWDMESTVEGLLYTYVTPRLLFYVIFKKEDINQEFFERQQSILSHLGEEYYALPVRRIEMNYYKDFLPRELQKEESCMYIVTHNNIEKMSKEEITKVSVNDMPHELQQKFVKVIAKLNNK